MSESNLDKILTIAGKPGLFRMVAQYPNGGDCYLTKRPKENCHQLQQINILSEIRVFGLKDEIPIK